MQRSASKMSVRSSNVHRSSKVSDNSTSRLHHTLAELHQRSAKFQRALDALAASHSSQVEILRSLVDEDHLVELATASAGSGLYRVGEASPSKVSKSHTITVLDATVREAASEIRLDVDGGEGLQADGTASAGDKPRMQNMSSVSSGQLGLEASDEYDYNGPGEEDEDFEQEAVSETLDLAAEVAGAICDTRVHSFWDLTPERHEQDSTKKMYSLPPTAKSSKSAFGRTMTSVSSKSEEQFAGSARRDRNAISRCCVVKPNSTTHLVLCLISLAVILYDILSFPLIVAFQLEQNRVLWHLDLGACLFWTFDLIMNFLTGYNDNDCIEMRMRRIAKRYVKTWFFFDGIVVLFDWTTQIMADVRGLGFARTLKSPRIVRIFFRTLRLLRVVKMVMVLEDVVQFVVSDWLSSTIGIAKLLLGMMIFNHFVACGWYYVGTVGNSAHWIDDLGNASVFHRYIASFHWSMTQYTPAPNGYHPQNEHERVYACLTLLLGICIFSAFLGKITSLLTHMSAAAFSRSRDLTSLKQYLVANMVSLEVANRINVFLRNRQRSRRILPYSEVRHFAKLPKSLSFELKYQAHIRNLEGHPLTWHFTHHEDPHTVFIMKLCSHAVTEMGLKWGDELLHLGTPATQMVFVKHGRLEYINLVAEQLIQMRPMLSDGANEPVVLGVGLQYQWACEMALWCQWVCQGHLQAKGASIVLALDAHVMHRLAAAGSPVVFSDLKRYGEAYTRDLCEALEKQKRGISEQLVDDCWGQLRPLTDLVESTYDVTLAHRPWFQYAVNPVAPASSWTVSLGRSATSSSLFSWFRR